MKIKENGGNLKIMDPIPMSEVLCDHAIKKYGQSNYTIFGYSEGHGLLTEYPMSNPVYNKFLDGPLPGLEYIPNRTEKKICSLIT